MRQFSERFSSCRTQQEYTQVGIKIFRFFRTEGSNRFPDRRRIPTCEARHGDFGQPRFRRLDGIAHGMIAFCRRRCSFPQFVGTADLLLLALRRRVLATLHLVALLYQLLKKNFKVLRLLCKDGVDDSAQAVTVAFSRRVNDRVAPSTQSKNWEKANPSLRYLPDLMEEIRKEYRDWLKRPEKFTAFMTKRMNLPDGSSEIKVCAYERIKATNRPVPVDDLVGRMCTCGIDFSKVTDMISVNLHFRDVDTRYDLNHSWLCLQSKDLPRIKAPWKEWADQGHITLVDDVEIHPELIVDYIATQMEYYSIKKMAIDDFRYALVAKYLQNIGFDAKVYKNLKLVRPSDIMKVAPVIDSCFANDYFVWGDNPVLRWATNNTKMVRYGRKPGKEDDADIGNFVYAKIEAKSRKTDPFMTLAASMTVEDDLPYAQSVSAPDLGVFTY